MDPQTPNAPPAVEAAPSPAPNPEKAAAARELVQGIIERMGVTAELTVDDRADGIHVGVKATKGGEALGPGRRGGVAESITYLVNKAINREEEGRKWVFVEVAGEPVAESAPMPVGDVDPAVKAMAEALIAKAKKLGGTLWLGPVPAPMRSLQAALQGAGAKVRAEGEGIHRRVIVEV